MSSTTISEKRKKANGSKMDDKKKKSGEEEEEKIKVIDLSQSDSEEEEAEKKKGDLSLKTYRDKLKAALGHLDEANGALLYHLQRNVVKVGRRSLDWHDEVKPVNFADPDAEILFPQVQLELLGQRFAFRDGYSHLTAHVIVDPVDWVLRILTRVDDELKPKEECSMELGGQDPTRTALCELIRCTFRDIFDDIYSDEEDEDSDQEEEKEEKEEEEEEEPVANKKRIKSEPATSASVSVADSASALTRLADTDKERPKLSDEFQAKVATILYSGLFRRNDYGGFLYDLMSSSGCDRSAFKELLAEPASLREDSNQSICERRRLWARVTLGKPFATDEELLQAIRLYNVACVELQSDRIDCIEEIKTLCRNTPELGSMSRSNEIWWIREMKRTLARSMMNLANMRNCILVDLNGTDSNWTTARWIAEELFTPEQTLPAAMDSNIVYDHETELKPVQEAWVRVEARIREKGFADVVL